MVRCHWNPDSEQTINTVQEQNRATWKIISIASLSDMTGRGGIMAQVRLPTTYLIKKLCNDTCKCIEQNNRLRLFILQCE